MRKKIRRNIYFHEEGPKIIAFIDIEESPDFLLNTCVLLYLGFDLENDHPEFIWERWQGYRMKLCINTQSFHEKLFLRMRIRDCFSCYTGYGYPEGTWNWPTR